MKKLLLLICALLGLGASGAWAESKLSKAVAGTYLFDSSDPALTVNKGGATITSSDGAIVIHHDNLSTVTNSRTYAAVVMRVDMPTTAPGSFSQFINLKTSSNNTASIGLGVTTAGKLKGTWEAGTSGYSSGYGPETTDAVTGEHTIVLLCNNDGTTIYVDGTGTSVTNSGLKCATTWTDLRIESGYVSCVKSIYVFSGEQKSNISDFFSELSNVVTVANGETESVSDNSTATRFFVASGGTLTADEDYDADKIEVAGTIEIASTKTLNVNVAGFDLTKITGEGNVTLDADATISGSKSTVATGKLTINEGKTLTLGTGQGQTNSIESFTSIDLAGTIKHNNSVATFNSVTVPTGKTGKIFAYDMGATSDGFKLAETTTLNGALNVCSKYNFQMKVDALAGSGDCLICGTTGDNFDASGTSSNEAATINIINASSYTGDVTVNNSNATVNLSGNLVGSSWTKTSGTLKYTGASLNGTTLDGVILAGTARISTSNTVNIKNLAGNNLNNTDHLYAFVGSGTINFYGTNDLTKKSDGSVCNSANIGYGSSANVIIKAGANVTAGVVLNSATLSSNAPITVEETATLTCVGSTHADNATLLIYSTNLTNNGTINLNADGRTSQVSALSGSGTLNVASGSTIKAPSTISNTMTLTGAGDVVLTSFPTSTAPTLSSWTGSVEFPANATAANITGIFNAWGNENSTIKLNDISGYFSQTSDPVNPTLNILSGKTLTINNGFSDSPTVLSKLTGEGNLNISWTTSRDPYKLTVKRLEDFSGKLMTANAPIFVDKLVVASAPAVDDLLIKTTVTSSGSVTLNTEDPDGLYVGLQRSSAYTWETTTVDDVEGIYVSDIDQVQRNRELATAVVTPYFSYIGTGVGKYTISLGANEYTTIGDFTTAISAWATTEDYVVPTLTLNQPTSAFYRFKAAARSASDDTYNWYMGGNADGIYSASTTDAQASDANTIFYLEKDGSGYHPISYVTGLYSNGTANNAIGTKSNFTFTQAIKANDSDQLLGEYKLVNTGTSKTIVMWSNAALNAISGNNDWSGWTIEPVESLPVTISSAGFATFYSPVALTVPAELTAYVGTISGDKLLLTTTDVIPANQGVILQGDEETYNLTIGGSSDLTSDIKGSAATVTKASVGEVLTLTQDGGKPVFRAYTGTNLTGFKGYLLAAAGVKSFTIDFYTDAITALQAEKLNNGQRVFDLNGRRVERIKRGLYVVNGRKVLINK